ncbi:radical SAM family heme chaperone HemW [Marinobacteraceae bacterium S3BR75-40.1]
MPLEYPPLGLYIHIPWCVRKCPYCDFNSHARSGSLPEEDYLQALLEDLSFEASAAGNRPVQTLFFGGGTPSLLSPEFYHRLLDALGKQLHLADDIEITLEANPGTTEAARFRGFLEAGINRLSLGVQSFSARQLERLGRIHDVRQAHRAIEEAQKAGFERLNVDLMFGLPGQTADEAVADLREALAHELDHLSWYQLTIEPNTEFYSRPPILPEDDDLMAIHERGREVLTKAGLVDYEVSAWSRPGEEARHNLNYWQFGDYLALGAGAHGKLTIPAENRILRYWKTRQPEAYLNRIGNRTAGQTEVAEEERPLEFLMNALRLRQGVPYTLYEPRTGLPLQALQQQLVALQQRGWLHSDRLAATDEGRLYLDSLLAYFVS